MAFWDGGLDDLTSVGVQVTATEEQVLEDGGSVMYLNPCPDPMNVFDGRVTQPCADQNGDAVLVPWRISTFNVTDNYSPSWNPSDKRIWHQMDEEFTKDWRRFPAYVGLLDDHSAEATSIGYGIEMHWTEHLRPYRFWSCTPIASDRDLKAVVALERAAYEMLYESGYLDLCWVFAEESTGEVLLEDLCVAFGVVKSPKPDHLTQRQWRDIKSQIREEGFHVYGNDDEDPAPVIARCLDYAKLVKKGLLRWSWDPPQGPDAWGVLEFKPITSYLKPEDAYAADFWERAISKREATLAKVEMAYFRDASRRNSFRYQEEISA